jgi:hypothetical protein
MKELAKMFGRQSGSANDVPQSECVHWIVPWDSDDATTLRHDDMFALASYDESRFFQGTNNFQVIYSRYLYHG